MEQLPAHALGGALECGVVDHVVAEGHELGPRASKRLAERHGHDAVVEDLHPRTAVLDWREPEGLGIERQRRRLVLDVARRGGLGRKPRPLGRSEHRRQRVERHALRDVKQEERSGVTGGNRHGWMP
jgi:hypothetical protein